MNKLHLATMFGIAIVVLFGVFFLLSLSRLLPGAGVQTCGSIDPESVCTDVGAPVCGKGGKTYGNECYACKAGVTSYVRGACSIEDAREWGFDRSEVANDADKSALI